MRQMWIGDGAAGRGSKRFITCFLSVPWCARHWDTAVNKTGRNRPSLWGSEASEEMAITRKNG